MLHLLAFYWLRSLNWEPPVDNLTRANNRVDYGRCDAPGHLRGLVEYALVRNLLESADVRREDHYSFS